MRYLSVLAVTILFVTTSISAQDAASQRTRRDARNDSGLCLSLASQHPVEQRLTACERSAGDSLELLDGADNRSQILQRKALLEYGLGQYQQALLTLDQADMLAEDQNAVIHEGSFGIGNDTIRARVFARTNRQDEALSLLEQARAVRPYSRSIIHTLDLTQLSITRDLAWYRSRLEQRSSLDPSAIKGLFYLDFMEGNLERANAIADLAVFQEPRMLDGWTPAGGDKPQEDLRLEVNFIFLSAYISAALDDQPAAERRFARARERIDNFVGPEPHPRPGRRVSRRELGDWEARRLVGNALRPREALWRRGIELRRAIKSREIGLNPNQEQGRLVSDLDIGPDILRLIADLYPETKRDFETLAARGRNELIQTLSRTSEAELIQGIPEPETIDNYPNFGRGHRSILLAGVFNGDRGYTVDALRPEDGGMQTIRFGTLSGSLATADELVILAVARYAQDEGKDSFILLARRVIERTSHVTVSYYPGLRSSHDENSGSEGSVLAVLLDSNSIPPEWEVHRVRLIRVADVLDSVGIRQANIEAARLALREQRARRQH
ncbi:MAG: hypothetical protein AABZ45_11780 [Pseudomonadota bacterium]